MIAEAEEIPDKDSLPLIKSDDFIRKGNVIYVKRFSSKTLDNILDQDKSGFNDFTKQYPFMRVFMPLVPMIIKEATKEKGNFIKLLHDKRLEIVLTTHDEKHLSFSIFKYDDKGEATETFKLLIPSEDL